MFHNSLSDYLEHAILSHYVRSSKLLDYREIRKNYEKQFYHNSKLKTLKILNTLYEYDLLYPPNVCLINKYNICIVNYYYFS